MSYSSTFLAIFLITFAVLLLLYALLKSKFKSPSWIKLIMIGAVVSAVFSWLSIADYRFKHLEPAYFNQGVEQLRFNPIVKHYVDGFSSYTLPTNLSKNPGSQAVFHIGIIGDSTTLYLTCTMEAHKEDWKLAKVVQDSVVKNK